MNFILGSPLLEKSAWNGCVGKNYFVQVHFLLDDH